MITIFYGAPTIIYKKLVPYHNLYRNICGLKTDPPQAVIIIRRGYAVMLNLLTGQERGAD